MSKQWGLTLLVFLSLALSATLVILNISLVRKNQQLFEETQRRVRETEIPVGTRVPELRGLDTKAQVVAVTPAGNRQTLLLVFSTSCPFCRQNWPTWERIFKGVDPDAVNVVLVDLSSSADEAFLRAHRADGLTMISKIDPAMIDPYRLGSVPQTILIGKDARVQKEWTGVLGARDEEYILATCSRGARTSSLQYR